MKEGQFIGKTAIVTGAGSGIGRASALALADGGATVAVVDISEAGAGETVDLIERTGGRAAAFCCNAGLSHDIEAMVAQVVERFGALHLAVNGVGGGELSRSIVDTSEEAWDRIVAINLKSAWLAMKYEIPRMAAAGGGAIVNIASMAGVSPMMVSSPAYSAAKAGLIHLTRYAARAHAGEGIRVNAVAPGLTRTATVARAFDEDAIAQVVDSAQFIKRAAEPEEVAAAVIYLLAPSSAMVTGITLPVCGGVP